MTAPKSGPKSGRPVEIRLAASENGRIGQKCGPVIVSGAQTRGKPVFGDAELDFDGFSTSRKRYMGHLAIVPPQESIFSVWEPYLPWRLPDYLEIALQK